MVSDKQQVELIDLLTKQFEDDFPGALPEELERWGIDEQHEFYEQFVLQEYVRHWKTLLTTTASRNHKYNLNVSHALASRSEMEGIDPIAVELREAMDYNREIIERITLMERVPNDQTE